MTHATQKCAIRRSDSITCREDSGRTFATRHQQSHAKAMPEWWQRCKQQHPEAERQGSNKWRCLRPSLPQDALSS